MDPKDLANITVYNDLLTVLKERGFSDAEASEIFLKLTAQAELEVTEEMMNRLSPEQQATLKSLPENIPALEIAEKLGLDSGEIDQIRAEKTAQLIEKMVPSLNE